MNNVKKTIGWADFTWNPIVGCTKGCWYCYAKKIYERFNKDKFETIHYYEERLNQPYKLKKPSKIFVCSMGDIFGEEVTEYMRGQVYSVIEANPQHTFQILTKQPQNISDRDIDCMPKNVWLGVTIAKDNKEMNLGDFGNLRNFKGIKFISYEPILNNVYLYPFVFDWVIVGILTNAKMKKDINLKQIIKGISVYYRETPIFMKASCSPYWDGELLREFPEDGERLRKSPRGSIKTLFSI